MSADPPQITTTEAPALPELVPGLKFAAIGCGLILVHCDVTIRPSQEKIWTKGKDNGFTIEFRFYARTLRRRRQAEIQGSPKNHRIRIPHYVADHGVNNLGLQQESGRVRPIAN